MDIFTTIFLKTIIALNQGLQFVGTAILIITMAIIITSFNHENKLLQILFTWLSVAGSLYAITLGMLTKTILESINLKFFIITRMLAKIFLCQIWALCKNSFKGIFKNLKPTNQQFFDYEFMIFKTLKEIDDYAFNPCQQLTRQYDGIEEASKKSFHYATMWLQVLY